MYGLLSLPAALQLCISRLLEGWGLGGCSASNFLANQDGHLCYNCNVMIKLSVQHDVPRDMR